MMLCEDYTQEACILHKELYTAKESQEWEKESSAGKSTPTGYPIPSGQPRVHTYIHTCNIIETEQVVFMYLGTYTYTQTYTHMYVTIINEKRGLEFEREKEEAYTGGFEGQKRRGRNAVVMS